MDNSLGSWSLLELVVEVVRWVVVEVVGFDDEVVVELVIVVQLVVAGVEVGS